MDDLPRILGKFSYISTKPDLYDVLFYPYIGAGAVIIARNLSFTLMQRLKDELNGVFADFRDDLRAESNAHESGTVRDLDHDED